MLANRLSSFMGLSVVIIFANGSDIAENAAISPFVAAIADVVSGFTVILADVLGILLRRDCESKATDDGIGNERGGAALGVCYNARKRPSDKGVTILILIRAQELN